MRSSKSIDDYLEYARKHGLVKLNYLIEVLDYDAKRAAVIAKDIYSSSLIVLKQKGKKE